MLEDLDLRARTETALEAWAQHIARAVHPDDDDARRDVAARFSIVPDDVMSFLAETATDVRARIRLDPTTGTVDKGALWYEEHLPAETALWGVFALSDPTRTAIHAPRPISRRLCQAAHCCNWAVNAGIGHGLVRFLADGVPA